MGHSYKNPFGGVNAVQLNEDKILEYWCNPFVYKLFSQIKEEDIFEDGTNIVFMGGRSTGKSMFLRYWSYPVQFKIADRDGLKYADIIKRKNGIGFYFRIDGAKLKSFQGYGFDAEYWGSIFKHYFELIVGRQYFQCFEELNKNNSNDIVTGEDVSALCRILDFKRSGCIESVIAEFDQKIKSVETYLGSVPFYKERYSPDGRGYSEKSISFEVPLYLIENNAYFKNINFILLLDEYENFLEYQQMIINTVLRFTDEHIKFRIGMRIEGFKKYDTVSEDDFIKEGREYRVVRFEDFINMGKDYKNFLFEISKKRLESVPVLKESCMTDIEKILGAKEDLELEAKELVQDNYNKLYDYFLKKNVLKKNDMDCVRYYENPLMELLNYVWLMRGKTAAYTKKAMCDYLEKRHTEEGKKYKLDYVDKYKLSLMFLLCSIYKKNKKYYSFNTYTFLSSGIIGHFIELCRRAFAEADWGEARQLIKDQYIEKDCQDDAAKDFSGTERHQIARIEKYGNHISKFIDNMGNLFKCYHLDMNMRYPETNQFAINIDSISNNDLKEALRAAIRWTVIQKKNKMQSSSPGELLSDTFTINRILSPCFQISYRTRGGFSVKLNEVSLKEFMENEGVECAKYLRYSGLNDKTGKTKSDSLNLFQGYE